MPSEASAGPPGLVARAWTNEPGPPSAYPARWEADVVLRDGSTMHIRPIRPGDADALARFHARQSPESIYFRFFAPKERLSEEDLRRLTHVDYVDRVALVLVSGAEIVAVGRYDRAEGTQAEVAFNVSDALQGKGLGSVLLEHLAAAARERGIRRFVADVLPTNARMLRVFRDAGYDIRQTYDDGVITVAFDIDPTERSLAVMAEREHHADARSLRGLLGASSVVVVAEGTADSVRLGRRVAESVLASPFSGPVHLVGSGLAELGAGVLDHLASVPGAVDLVVVAAPDDRLPVLAREAGRLGAHGLVVLNGGRLGLGGAGRLLLLRAARDGGLRLVGPESFGLVADGPAGRLDATLWRELPPAGGVSLFCQSAAAGLALMAAASRRGLGLATFLSAGHRADVSGNDAMQFWQDHPGTAVGAVYLESIGNPRKFTRVARRLSARIPVVVVVSGQTGQAVPPGHAVRTSREPRRVLEEFLRQAGVVRARSTHEMLDIAQLFVSQPRPKGDRVAVLTNSGSLAGLVSEVARANGLRPAAVAHLEPLAGAAEYRAALEALVARDDWDPVVVACFPPLGERDPGLSAAVVDAAEAGARPVLACIYGLSGMAPELRREGAPAGTGVPAFASVEDAVRALAAAVRYTAWAGTDRGRHLVPPGADARAARAVVERAIAGLEEGASRVLSGAEVAELLACFGVRVWPARRVGTLEDAVTAAEALGWPVAVKVVEEHLRHRLDLGGVRLGIGSAEELGEALAHLDDVASRVSGPPRLYDVQAMAPMGVACVVGGTEDELYGPIVSFGLAGDAVELLGDVAYRIPPVTEADVRDMVRSVRAAPRLLGYRGLPPADVAALEDLLLRVAALKDDLPEVTRLVLNPVLVAEAGLAVLEASVELAHPARADGSRRALPG